ncbi:MAG: RNA methyltransferase [Verrucomicrobia bacterium]|nr:RNA methyltransferase [Verrucomicrobiota bacterium]
MSLREISSLQHPLVKHLVKLRESRDYRYECRRIVVSGQKLIKELSPRFRLRSLFIENGTSLAFSPACEEVFCVTPQILKKVTGLESPEPIAAEIDMPAEADLSSAQFLLILDGVSDPGNLGTLLRTAKALGWDGAYLTQGSTDPFNEKALRAAKGATFTLPWKSGSWENLSQFLKIKKMSVLAADAKGSDLAACKASPPLALALGNEARGLTPDLKKVSQLIAIPMMGRMESLNVATAGAILMYALKENV